MSTLILPQYNLVSIIKKKWKLRYLGRIILLIIAPTFGDKFFKNLKILTMEWVYIPYKNHFSINHSELPKNNSCWERNIQTFVMVEDFNEIQVKRYCSRHEPRDTKFIAPMDNSTIMHLWLHLHNRHWVSESTQQTLSLRYKHYRRLSNATPQRISLSNTDTANISLQLRLCLWYAPTPHILKTVLWISKILLSLKMPSQKTKCFSCTNTVIYIPVALQTS